MLRHTVTLRSLYLRGARHQADRMVVENALPIRPWQRWAGSTRANALIGTVRLEAFQHVRERHKVALTAMYVMKDFANAGIGRRLVDEALAAAPHARHRIINLYRHADNLPAVRLYSRQGFQSFGRETRAVKTAGAYLDNCTCGGRWAPTFPDPGAGRRARTGARGSRPALCRRAPSHNSCASSACWSSLRA